MFNNYEFFSIPSETCNNLNNFDTENIRIMTFNIWEGGMTKYPPESYSQNLDAGFASNIIIKKIIIHI